MSCERRLLRRIRVLLAFFTVALALSGLTAFPLVTEVRWLAGVLGAGESGVPEGAGPLVRWIATVRDGLIDAQQRHPFLAYGTDWLAFGHLAIAVAFLGPLRDPVRNVWVITAGMIACVGVVPTALFAGPVREIPFFWQLVDCSFGVIGFIPLWFARRDTMELARVRAGGEGGGEASPSPVSSSGMPRGESVPEVAAARPSRKEHEGATIRVRPVDPARDAAALFAASHGSALAESLWTYMGYGPFASEAAMAAWLQECAASEDPLFFTVLDRSSGAPLGMLSFLDISAPARSIELGHIWYGPDAQRSTVNTEAMFLMLEEAFAVLRCRRVEWKCDALNARSRAAALRLGFRFEGIFRQHLIVKGHNRDTAWYSMLDHEWPTVRAALRRWLDWPDDPRPSVRDLRSGAHTPG